LKGTVTSLGWVLTGPSLNGSIGYTYLSNQGMGITTQQQLTLDNAGTPVSNVFNTRNADSRSGTHSVEVSLDYKKKFKKDGQELELLYSGSFGVPNSNYSQTQIYTGQNFPYE
jgi:ferric enterobactin receptor